ncbi:unnamed protein product [Somion occarium]|uniref:B-related factor 1 n=1 Tax=Somion occarium TaxID=3059160 RepID=A0ABP1D518_9APHY
MTVCTDCGGTVIEYDVAAGNGFCVNCGTVVEENTIVNEVTFGETSTGAAMVQGSFVGQGATRARMGGPFGNRGSTESREQTIANATRKIQQVASAMRLSEVVQLAATRLYTLAVEHKFTKGRKNLLQVNVFELGHTYLQLVQTLNLRLPLVDPSHYISRFAALLEFGEETPQVALDATRLVQRFDRDWMTRGRRPSGICGAALLLAARMNNFRRSVEEIVQVVKIADTTLRKRVEEFRRTGSASLSVADFRSVWLEEEMDPPAFIKGREKERALEEEGEEGEAENKGKVKSRAKGRGRKRKRKRGEESENEEPLQEQPSHPPPVDPALLHQGIFADALKGGLNVQSPDGTLVSSNSHPQPLFLPEDGEDSNQPHIRDTNAFIDPALLGPSHLPSHIPQPNGTVPSQGSSTQATLVETSNEMISMDDKGDHLEYDGMPPPLVPSSSTAPDLPQVDEEIDNLLTSEVSQFLTSQQGVTLASALEHAQMVRQSQFTGDDELLGLNEDELDLLLLTEDEVKIKERVWVELNKEYLEAIAAKAEMEAAGGVDQKKSRKRRKTDRQSNKPRDAANPHGTTAAESVRNLLKKNPRYSKRINYDALKDLFTDTGSPGPGLLTMPSTPSTLGPSGFDDKDDEVYHDDKSDGEGITTVVVEEGGGGVGVVVKGKGVALEMEGEEDEGSDKGEEYAEWDVYEQEV